MPPSSHDSRTGLLIVDDHESVRAGLRFLLAGEEDFEILGEACSVETALAAIDALNPEIVVLDFGLGTQTAAQVLDELATRPHAPRVLMLSMEDERVVGQELTRRGAVEYVMKQSPTDQILAALRRIRSTLHADAATAATQAHPQAEAAPVHLTKREREVLLLVKEGLPSKTIARRLQISEKTVDVHKHKLRRKLHLRTEAELARHAALFVVDATQR
jgi:DNA-binding NarL/FixJ family response regulator